MKEAPRELALVRRQPIPYDRQRSGDVAQQRCQKLHHLGTLDRPFVKTEVEVVEGQAGDGRHVVPVEVVLQDGGLAARRPSPHPMRPLAHSAFVDEDDGTALRPGFFLILGQLPRFHWRIASSFRSRARPSGRWQLQPRPSSTFQTWPGWYWTPNSLSIRWAIRQQVHSGVSYPSTSGPFFNNSPRRSRSVSLNSGLRPARPAFFNACLPFLLYSSAHRLTVWRQTFSRTAISDWLRSPFSSSRTAFIRRFSSASKSRATPAGFPILSQTHSPAKSVAILCDRQ